MLDFVFSNQNQMSGPRRPRYGSFYVALALPIALIVWFLRKVPALIRFFKDLPPTQIGAIPPRRIPSLLNSSEVAAATTNCIRCAFSSLEPCQAYSSDSDCSDDERRPMNQHFLYLAIESLNIGGANLFVPASMEQYLELVRELPDANIRQEAFQDAREDGGVYSLSDVPPNTWILREDTETFSGPSELTNESTRTWVLMLKVTTKIICLIWMQLRGQDWQLSEEQELKEELFAEVVKQPSNKLLEVTHSFSDARWSDGNICQQLTIFDALVDVLFNIRHLPFNRSSEVADIFNKMVNAFKGSILDATNDIHGSEECIIHPATIVLIRAMEFFYRNRDMVKSIFDNGNDNTDPQSDMYNCWLSKLKEDEDRTFEGRGRMYLFILNNMYYFWQKKCHPELLPSVLDHLDSEIKQYITMYLNECWCPAVSYQDGDSVKSHRMSLKKFTGEIFNICDEQMTWKVQPALKKELREKILELVVVQYEEISKAPLANGRQILPKWLWRLRTEKQEDIGAKLKLAIGEVFES